MTARQATQIFRSLRKAFTPLSQIHAPLHVGTLDREVRLEHPLNAPEEIYLLQQGVWHAAVRNLGDKGTISDEQMAELVDPIEATRNLLASVRQNISSLESFLSVIAQQPNGAHILERCLREPIARTVWMVRSQPPHFPTEQEIDRALDEIDGHAGAVP